MLFKIAWELWKMHIEYYTYILSESGRFVERPESSEFEVTYKEKFQLENSGIKISIIGTDKSYTGIKVL